ncbi:hypothetical protein [Neobacillus niacini]|nr:hypothetical protein [Neobacillus niacini]MDR7001493.1 hypothetical protein [Neobacillus niacini]
MASNSLVKACHPLVETVYPPVGECHPPIEARYPPIGSHPPKEV